MFAGQVLNTSIHLNYISNTLQTLQHHCIDWARMSSFITLIMFNQVAKSSLDNQHWSDPFDMQVEA